MITLAISKGRMQDDAFALLAAAGVTIDPAALATRRLAVEDELGSYRIVLVKPADVPVYVEHGIADCGFVGRDVLMESAADLLLPLDLGIARCRLVVASTKVDALESGMGMLRVATKYVKVSASYFGDRGIPVEIIPLSGSVELAPALGLADVIVDLVETGRTLKENGLLVLAEVAESTGCLVVNRASYQLKTQAVSQLIAALSGEVAGVSTTSR